MNDSPYETLYENIKANAPDHSEQQQNQGAVHTWLIFNANDEIYAIESEMVKELLRNNEVFPLPFVPPYIKGVLNCYGDPYAIVDFSAFLGNEEQRSKLFMILQGDENLSIQITDIVEFQTDSQAGIQKLADNMENSYFTGAITYDGRSIPVLNLEGIISKIRSDLGNS